MYHDYSLTPAKKRLIASAEIFIGRPFYTAPVDARIKRGMVEVKVQMTHELEPNWTFVCDENRLPTMPQTP